MSDPPKTMRIALLGDIHLHRVMTAPWRMLGKRLVGHLNPLLNRGRTFDIDRLAAALEHVPTLEPDLVLFSGDFTTTSLPREFRAAAAMVRPLAEEIQTVVVAGNHDRYTFGAARASAFLEAFSGMAPTGFPHLQPLTGHWHLLCLDSAVPRAVSSSGRLGDAQIEAVADLLDPLPDNHGLVVLCHYPFVDPPGKSSPPGHGLVDAADLAQALGSFGGPIVFCHGHVHEPWAYRPDGLENVIDLNAGSPTMINETFPLGQGFWTFELTAEAPDPPRLVHHLPTPDGWSADPVNPVDTPAWR